jgi:Flp pilus assembly protein TadG
MKSEAGGALVEYALIIMVFMTMLLGIMEFSRGLYSYHFVSNAAREATRWAAVNGASCGAAGDNSCNGTAPMNNGPATATDIQNYVTNLTPMGIDPTQLTTTPTWPPQAKGPTVCNTVATRNSAGCTVQVQVSYTFNFIFPFVRSSPMTLSSTSEMIIAH